MLTVSARVALTLGLDPSGPAGLTARDGSRDGGLPDTVSRAPRHMLLAIDVGNSNTSIGVFEGDTLRGELRLSTRRDWTRDEFAIKLERALGLAGLAFDAIRESVLACVVPPVEGPIRAALERYVGVDTLVVGPGIDVGMPVLYEPAKDVGADRLVAAIAAHRRYAQLPSPSSGARQGDRD